MRKLAMALVAFTAALATQSSVNAAERQFLIFVWDDGRTAQYQTYQEPAPQYGQATQPTYHYEQRQGGNVFEQLMEMERRKNAWLRRTFLGRD